jgi:hypothetical protein
MSMIYCPTCVDDEDFDASLCVLDSWGIANCTAGGCPGTLDNPQPCWNMFESIPMASYYALLNLFGEFPLVQLHSNAGKVVGAFTAVVAVAVFALPAGIIGNGFQDVLDQRRKREGTKSKHVAIVEQGGMTPGFRASETTFRGRLYNLLNPSSDATAGTTAALVLDRFINILIVVTALSFMVDTVGDISPGVHVLLDSFELLAVTIFTLEYMFRVFAAKEDPKYQGRNGHWAYMTTFLAIVDVLSFAPFWLEIALTGNRLLGATS